LGYDETLIQRVVFDGANRLRDISSARTFRGILRRVLDVVHRRCDHKTCFVPAHQREGDHILAWTDDGLTTQDNGRLGCGFHNRWWYTQRHTEPPDGGADPPDGADSRPLRVPVEITFQADPIPVSLSCRSPGPGLGLGPDSAHHPDGPDAEWRPLATIAC